MITEQSSPCSTFRECLTPKSVKSCASPKERYVRDSFTRTGSCKITWTNFGKILSRNGANMDEFNDNEIARLLRLKRYEQPPPGYFENFLHEFHRRQRDEMLRQPLWRICLERAHAFMSQLDMASLASYPTAVAAVLVCAAVISLKVYQQPETARVAIQSPSVLSAPANAEQEWSLGSPVGTPILRMQPVRGFRDNPQTPRAAPPRYVLDSVPVSYEPTFRF